MFITYAIYSNYMNDRPIFLIDGMVIIAIDCEFRFNDFAQLACRL